MLLVVWSYAHYFCGSYSSAVNPFCSHKICIATPLCEAYVCIYATSLHKRDWAWSIQALWAHYKQLLVVVGTL